MKYHFIYPDIRTGYYPSTHHGLAQLFAILKANKHEVSLHHVKKEPKQIEIISRVKDESPDIVGFTTMTNQVKYVELWSRWIKQVYNIPIVCGGVHATLNPEEILAIPSVDMVCVGEGDRAIIDRHFGTKKNGSIVKSMPYPLVQSLDELPFPDYSLFDCGNMLKARNGDFAVMVSRGCPYSCYYCCNSALRERQNGLGKYFRYRSVKNTLEMLIVLLANYPIRSFSFADDIFGIDKEWVYEFCESYPRIIGLPFSCNLRVETASLELLEALKTANCIEVEMGIESGSYWMRREVLNRSMSNQKIIDAFENAHRLGIRTRAYNMIGLPYETPDMVRETISLNKCVSPDDVAVFYFFPYRGTRLHDVCQEEGFLTGKQATGYVAESILKLPTISVKELKDLHDEFYRYIVMRKSRLYGAFLGSLLRCIGVLLRLITFGNEIKIMEWGYLRLFPLFQKLRR